MIGARIFFVAALAFATVAVTGCGGDDGSGADSGPGSTDSGPSGTDSGPSGADAGSLIDCGGTTCSGSEECCFTTAPPTFACVAAGSCGGGSLSCDEQADCPGQECCHNPPTDIGTACVDGCDGMLVCADAGECPMSAANCCPALGGSYSICRNAGC